MEVLVSIKSKADALVFSINKVCENGKPFNEEEVDSIYNYITSKVELPDIERNVQNEYIDSIGRMLGKYTSVLENISSDIKV